MATPSGEGKGLSHGGARRSIIGLDGPPGDERHPSRRRAQGAPARTPKQEHTVAINLNKALDKAYEGKSLKELVNMPLSGFEGLTDEHQKHLAKLGLETVSDLANWKFVAWAQTIVTLAKTEE
jgi:hypothetical protein